MADTLILDLEGVVTRYCWPALPSYADATYVLGLTGAPRGVSSEWNPADGSASIGKWSATFRPGLGAVDWYRTGQEPLAYLTAATTASSSPLTIDRTNTQAGLTDDTDYYLGRETVTTGTLTGGSTSTPVTRAANGSLGAIHPVGTPIWAQPPALLGRRATLSRADQTGGSTGTEDVWLRGQVDSDISSDLWFPTLSITEQGERLTINREPLAYVPTLTVYGPDNSIRGAQLAAQGDAERGDQAPTLRTDGAYLYLPDAGSVLRVAYVAAAGNPNWQVGAAQVVWGSTEVAALDTVIYEVAYSGADADEGYPVFGSIPNGGSYTPSYNPVDIALNLLLSLDGTNKGAGEESWDRGTALYPHYALGVARTLVDLDSFTDARAILAAVPARNLWIGGPEPLDIRKLFHALLGPWGYTVGTTRGGLWRLLRFGDVYPGTVTSVAATERSGLSTRVYARQLDRITLECDTGPEGEGDPYPVVLADPVGADLYPPETGADLVFEAAPYRSDDILPALSGYRSDEAASSLAALVQSRIRRLTGRLTEVSLPIPPSQTTTLEVGDEIELTGIWLRDPADGDRITSAEALGARVTGISGVDYAEQRGQLTAIVTAQAGLQLGRHAPSARVDANAAPAATTFSVDQTEHAAYGEDATDHFAAGMAVRLVDSTGAPRSNVDGTYPTLVVAVTATTVQVDVVFKNDAGAEQTPVDGDRIVFAIYAETKAAGTAAQTTNYAFFAQGGLGAEELASGDTLYRYGD